MKDNKNNNIKKIFKIKNGQLVVKYKEIKSKNINI